LLTKSVSEKKSLIYDPDSNGQIWNQPVYGYEISYYNPITDLPGHLNQTKVTMLEIAENNNQTSFLNFFARKAGPQTRSAVGVRMHVNYVFENPPQKGETQLPDNLDSRDYKFLLELDQNDNIVGGEWTKNSHPIFIWGAAEGEKPFGYGDDLIQSFDGSVESLRNLTAVAKEGSKKNVVLGAVVKYFINHAKNSTA